MTEMYIFQNMGHESHKKIQEIWDLGIVKVLCKNIPQLTVPWPICIIVKDTHLIHQPTVRIPLHDVIKYVRNIRTKHKSIQRNASTKKRFPSDVRIWDLNLEKNKQKLLHKVAEERKLKTGEIIYPDLISQRKPSYGGSKNWILIQKSDKRIFDWKISPLLK